MAEVKEMGIEELAAHLNFPEGTDVRQKAQIEIKRRELKGQAEATKAQREAIEVQKKAAEAEVRAAEASIKPPTRRGERQGLRSKTRSICFGR